MKILGKINKKKIKKCIKYRKIILEQKKLHLY